MFKEFGRKLNFLVLGLIVLVILIGNNSYNYITDFTLLIDSGDTAWMIVSCALVLLMTPGLAFFYGGRLEK